jgi:hypothetical protein
MMKSYLLTLIVAGLTYAAPSAIAQNSGSTDSQSAQTGAAQSQGRRHREFDPAKRAAKLGKKLKLNSDQQAKVQDVLTSEKSQMEALRSDSATGTDRRAKMMDIRKTSDDQIRGILDSNQQKKWDEMQSKREQKYGNRGNRQAAAPPSNS